LVGWEGRRWNDEAELSWNLVLDTGFLLSLSLSLSLSIRGRRSVVGWHGTCNKNSKNRQSTKYQIPKVAIPTDNTWR